MSYELVQEIIQDRLTYVLLSETRGFFEYEIPFLAQNIVISLNSQTGSYVTFFHNILK
jgi:hypothetical protein